MASCKTEWVAPGEGETVNALRKIRLRAPHMDNRVGERRTNLRVPTIAQDPYGEDLEPYDFERIDAALEEYGRQ